MRSAEVGLESGRAGRAPGAPRAPSGRQSGSGCSGRGARPEGFTGGDPRLPGQKGAPAHGGGGGRVVARPFHARVQHIFFVFVNCRYTE